MKVDLFLQDGGPVFPCRWTSWAGIYSVYKEIAEKLSVEAAVEMYNLFKGQQIMFPQRLYCKEYIVAYVKEHYTGHNIRELSRELGYTDRYIRQVVREVSGGSEGGGSCTDS